MAARLFLWGMRSLEEMYSSYWMFDLDLNRSDKKNEHYIIDPNSVLH